VSVVAPATSGRAGLSDPPLVRFALIGLSMLFLGLLVLTPLVLVFAQAFSSGVGAFLGAIADPIALSAIALTMLVAAIVVPINLGFGLAAAWLIARFSFAGRTMLMSLIDIPLAVSPVISGMVFVLLFGAQGFFGPSLRDHDMKIIFAVPGIVLATLFVTFPLVAREVIPVMEAAGSDEEMAGLTLGANSWQTFWRITLPKVKWGVLYGVLLTNARAMGEFGAVSVVSGHIRGETNTIPLHAEILFNEYSYTGAFAMASLLAVLGLATLVAQQIIGWASRRERSDG
jgi:sulfate transport system permease protein